MHRFISFIFLSVTTLTVAAQNHASAIKKVLLDAHSDKVLVVAHRASHQLFPENSIPAIQDAIRLGVDILELDVKVTADGVPILMHDRTIDRTTTGKGNPETMTWKELSAFKLLHNNLPTQERIPTLEEALLEAKGKVLVDLDMKTSNVAPVLEVVRKTGMGDYVVFFDGDAEVLKEIRTFGSYFVMPRARDIHSARAMLDLFAPPIVHIDENSNTPEVSGLIQSRNARVWINALGATDKEIAAGNGMTALQTLLSAGATIVQTDEPQRLIDLLQQLDKRPQFSADR